ncbi:hypothetical protein cyc_00596 [Cyclospora cayetanensis]|nr:hypothetical protein cyc_00596 [Cyclospora cayetanensis]
MASPPVRSEPAATMTLAEPQCPQGRVRFDRRLLLVYGVLLLDVVVIGSTSLQHVWQPANLIDKVLQNHSTPVSAATPLHTPMPQHQLPVAVKRELGMSCCCGWLALAVMGTLSLLVSYSLSTVAPGSASTLTSGSHRRRQNTTSVRRSHAQPLQGKEEESCSVCMRTLDELELQMKLKYLLVAVATFLVFFTLNLVVQIHGRFQQSKMTVAALKTFAADTSAQVSSQPSAHDLYGAPQDDEHRFHFHTQRDEYLGTTGMSDIKRAAEVFQGMDASNAVYRQEYDGPVNPQSPPYFYWRDFFFWMELSRECFLDGEIQLSGLWVLLHAATLLSGRAILRTRTVFHANAD